MNNWGLALREPYPVYRALRVPVWEHDEVVKVRRVTQEDVDAFANAMSVLKEVLTGTLNSVFVKDLSQCEKLRILADLIVFFYKTPSMQEISPAAPTPVKANVVATILGTQLLEGSNGEALQNPFSLAELVSNGVITEVLKKLPVGRLLSHEVADLVHRVWIAFPADTRPGFNTSSLISHHLLSSAIAWALYVERSSERSACREATLRIASLLHDLGKAFDPGNHVNASVLIAENLLKGLLPEGDFEEITRIIRKHHESRGLISEADQVASGSDRLSGIVEKLIGEKLRRLEEEVGLTRNEWEFYRKLYEKTGELKNKGLLSTDDPVRELSEEFIEKAEKSTAEQLPGAKREDLVLVLIDLGSIQDFVYRSQEIRGLTAASNLVDLITHAHIYLYLRSQLNIPPEAILLAGGGSILLLIPRVMMKDVEKKLEEYKRILNTNAPPLTITYAFAKYETNYASVSEELGREIARMKHTVKLVKELVPDAVEHVGAMGLCRLCYSAPASVQLNTPDGVLPTCPVCKNLYELGGKVHFKPRWESEVEVGGVRFSAKSVFNKEWDVVSKWIMEVIAGHDPEEFEGGVKPQRLRDYAVVKMDGNTMGLFMYEAISFTDAVERSFRIDYALKKAYRRAVEAVYEAVKEKDGEQRAMKEVSRIFLGTIYMGGDDGLLLIPSWMSIPFAHYIAEEFSRGLGCARGLAVSVAASKARANVWALIDSANGLMKEVKEKTRTLGGGIVFDIYEGMVPTGREARRRIDREEAVKRGAAGGIQLYGISLSALARKKAPDLWRTALPAVLCAINNDLSSVLWDEATSLNYAKIAIAEFYDASWKWESTIEGEYLRRLRREVFKSLREVGGLDYSRELLYVFVHREAETARNSGKGTGGDCAGRVYEKLIEYLNKTMFDEDGNFRKDSPPGLPDLIVLAKFAKGGAW